MGSMFPYGICRLCGTHPPNNGVSALKIPSLLEILKKHLDLQIKETDKCSQLVCQSCVNCVKNFSVFSARVKATQLTIEQCILLQAQESEAAESEFKIKNEDEILDYIDESRSNTVDELILVAPAQRPDTNEPNIDYTKRPCPKTHKSHVTKRRKTLSSSTTPHEYTLLNSRCVTCDVFVKTTFEKVFHDYVHMNNTCLYCMEDIGTGPELDNHFMNCLLAQCHSVDVLMRYVKKCSVPAFMSYDNLQPHAQLARAPPPSVNIANIDVNSKPQVKKTKHEHGETLLISEKIASHKRNHTRKSHFQKVPVTLKMSTGTEPKTDLHTLSIPAIRHRVTIERMSQQYTSQNFLLNVEKIFALKPKRDKSTYIPNAEADSSNSTNTSLFDLLPSSSTPEIQTSDNEDDDCHIISAISKKPPMLYTRIRSDLSKKGQTTFISLLDESSDDEEMRRLVIDETQEKRPTEENVTDSTLSVISESGPINTNTAKTNHLSISQPETPETPNTIVQNEAVTVDAVTEPIVSSDSSTSTQPIKASTKSLSISSPSMAETPNTTVPSDGFENSLFKSITGHFSVAPSSISETLNESKKIDSSDSVTSTQQFKTFKRRLSIAPPSTMSETPTTTIPNDSLADSLFKSIRGSLSVTPPSVSVTLNATKPILSSDASTSSQPFKTIKICSSPLMSETPNKNVPNEYLDDSLFKSISMSETLNAAKSINSSDSSTSLQPFKKFKRRSSIAPPSMSESPHITVRSEDLGDSLFKSITGRLSVAPSSMSVTPNATKQLNNSDSLRCTQKFKTMKRRNSIAYVTRNQTGSSDSSIKTQLFESISKRLAVIPPSMSDVATKSVDSLIVSASTQSSDLRRILSSEPAMISQAPKANVTVSSGSSDSSIKTQLFESISRFLPVAPKEASASTNQSKIFTRRLSVAPASMSETSALSSGGADHSKTMLFQKIARLAASTSIPESRTKLAGCSDTIVDTIPMNKMTTRLSIAPHTILSNESSISKHASDTQPLMSRRYPSGDLDTPVTNNSSEFVKDINSTPSNLPTSVQPDLGIVKKEASNINGLLSHTINAKTKSAISSAENQITFIDLIDDSSDEDDMPPLVIDETPLDQPPFEIRHVRTLSNQIGNMASSSRSLTTVTTNKNSKPNHKEWLFQSMAKHLPNQNSSKGSSFDNTDSHQTVPMSMAGHLAPSNIQLAYTNVSVGNTSEQIQLPEKSYTSTSLQDAISSLQQSIRFSGSDSSTAMPVDNQQMYQNNSNQPTKSVQSGSLTNMANMVSTTFSLPRRKVVPLTNRAGLQVSGSDRLNILSPQAINNRVFNNLPRH